MEVKDMDGKPLKIGDIVEFPFAENGGKKRLYGIVKSLINNIVGVFVIKNKSIHFDREYYRKNTLVKFITYTGQYNEESLRQTFEELIKEYVFEQLLDNGKTRWQNRYDTEMYVEKNKSLKDLQQYRYGCLKARESNNDYLDTLDFAKAKDYYDYDAMLQAYEDLIKTKDNSLQKLEMQLINDNTMNTIQSLDTVLGALVYHNSPYLLKKADGSFIDPKTGEKLGFDHRFMGKGEGAQVHGWGCYFSVEDLRKYAENLPAAVYYDGKLLKDKISELAYHALTANNLNIDNALYSLERKIETIKNSSFSEKAKKSFLKEYEDIISELEHLDQSKITRDNNNHNYVVEIPDDDGFNYLEEDKPIKPKQLAKIVSYLNKKDKKTGDYFKTLKGTLCSNIYYELTLVYKTKEMASKFLKKCGIVGIHYFGKTDGECYVIFDENDAKIVKHELYGLDGMETFEGLGSLRTEKAPQKTITCYKLMRLQKGKLYPLFIDSAEPVKIGVWYDADSPDFNFLKTLKSDCYYLMNMTSNKVLEKSNKKPKKEDIITATSKGCRWIYIEETDKKQRRFGENRKYWNMGLDGGGSVSTFSMRPGWHAGSLPTMRQIGKGSNRNLRDDSFVWTECEITADIDYNPIAQKNPDKDMPDTMPKNGYYLKATNADKVKSQADKVGWYVAGAIKINRIISDREACSIIDNFNKRTGLNVLYDYERESGKEFDPKKGLCGVDDWNINFIDKDKHELFGLGSIVSETTKQTFYENLYNQLESIVKDDSFEKNGIRKFILSHIPDDYKNDDIDGIVEVFYQRLRALKCVGKGLSSTPNATPIGETEIIDFTHYNYYKALQEFNSLKDSKSPFAIKERNELAAYLKKCEKNFPKDYNKHLRSIYLIETDGEYILKFGDTFSMPKNFERIDLSNLKRTIDTEKANAEDYKYDAESVAQVVVYKYLYKMAKKVYRTRKDQPIMSVDKFVKKFQMQDTTNNTVKESDIELPSDIREVIDNTDIKCMLEKEPHKKGGKIVKQHLLLYRENDDTLDYRNYVISEKIFNYLKNDRHILCNPASIVLYDYKAQNYNKVYNNISDFANYFIQIDDYWTSTYLHYKDDYCRRKLLRQYTVYTTAEQYIEDAKQYALLREGRFHRDDLICYKGFEETIFKIVGFKGNNYIVIDLADRTKTKNEIPMSDNDKLQMASFPLLVKEMELLDNFNNLIKDLETELINSKLVYVVKYNKNEEIKPAIAKKIEELMLANINLEKYKLLYKRYSIDNKYRESIVNKVYEDIYDKLLQLANENTKPKPKFKIGDYVIYYLSPKNPLKIRSVRYDGRSYYYGFDKNISNFQNIYEKYLSKSLGNVVESLQPSGLSGIDDEEFSKELLVTEMRLLELEKLKDFGEKIGGSAKDRYFGRKIKENTDTTKPKGYNRLPTLDEIENFGYKCLHTQFKPSVADFEEFGLNKICARLCFFHYYGIFDKDSGYNANSILDIYGLYDDKSIQDAVTSYFIENKYHTQNYATKYFAPDLKIHFYAIDFVYTALSLNLEKGLKDDFDYKNVLKLHNRGNKMWKIYRDKYIFQDKGKNNVPEDVKQRVFNICYENALTNFPVFRVMHSYNEGIVFLLEKDMREGTRSWSFSLRVNHISNVEEGICENSWGDLCSHYAELYVKGKELYAQKYGIEEPDKWRFKDKEGLFAKVREGKDWRNGRNAEPKDFIDTFGFRAVEFGETMPQKERWEHLNRTFDSFMDLCDVLNIKPENISLGGSLAISFGSRGRGGKHAPAAHYEPSKKVINLTRRNGAGCLAHEWFHAFDNQVLPVKIGEWDFSENRGKFASNDPESIWDTAHRVGLNRPDDYEYFYKLNNLQLNYNGFIDASFNLDKYERRSPKYWSTCVEYSARAFEWYVIKKLSDKNQINEYLAQIPTAEPDRMKYYPYPHPVDYIEVESIFNGIFANVQQVKTETGVTIR